MSIRFIDEHRVRFEVNRLLLNFEHAELDTSVLAVEPAETRLVTGATTTVEQTLLDLADRPGLGGLAPREVGEAVTALALRADWDEVVGLARRQRLHAAYVRVRWVAARVLEVPPPAWPPRRPVDGLELVDARGGDADFAITHDASA